MLNTKLLTLRQLDFCSRFLSSGNGAKSYRAVYKCSRASAQASAARLLADERVKAVIKAARRDAHAKLEMSATWLAERVKEEAEREGDGATHAGRVAALKLASELLGAFRQHGTTGGAPTRSEDDHSFAFGAADRMALEAILERGGI